MLNRNIKHRCEYTGLACFTVRHKDENGKWVQNGKKTQ